MADRPIAITLGEKDKNISWTLGTQVLQASVKNSIKSISPWKKKDSPVEPRRKIRYVTLGLFLLYTPLSLSQFEGKRKKRKEERHLCSWTVHLLYIWHFESVSLCIVKDSCILMLPCGRSCSLQFCYEFVVSHFLFQLLFALCYLVSNCPINSFKISHGKPELPTTTI